MHRVPEYTWTEEAHNSDDPGASFIHKYDRDQGLVLAQVLNMKLLPK